MSSLSSADPSAIASAALKPHLGSLQNALKPIHQANGLPNACYRDDTVLAAEAEIVFKQGWAALGHSADVPNMHDVKVKTFFGMPLIIVHGDDGEIRVFHNVCRHRGMKLVEDDTNTRVLRCRYHSWTYGLDGDLRQAPHVGGHGKTEHSDFDYKCASLKQVRSAVMFGTVFVNLDGQAEAFETYIAPVAKRWASLVDTPLFSQGGDTRFMLEVSCNWKLAVENYCEAYHLPFVHPELNRNSRLEDHYNIEEADYAGQGSLDYKHISGSDGQTFPLAKNLAPFWDKGAEYVALFPNVLLGAHKDHFFSIVLEPVGGEQTREHIQLYYYDQEVETEKFGAMRQEVRRFWYNVFEEDIFAVEGMQKGRHSPGYDGGLFSPAMDGPTVVFHRWMANKLIAGAQNGRHGT